MDNFIGMLIRNSYAIGIGWLIAATNLGIGIILVYYLGFTTNQQLIAFWILTPLSYELFYWWNLSLAPYTCSIGLILVTIHAVTGAAISSIKPLPMEKRL